MRWLRRRNEATERSRTSSAESAVTTVSRPRRFSAPARGAFGAGAGRAATPPRRGLRGASSSSASSVGRGVAADLSGVAVSAPNRFLATSSALRLVSSSCLRRSSSSRLRASAFARSAFSSSSRVCRIRASSSAILRSSASRKRASASACARALRSSSVSVRNTTPDGFAGAAADAADVGALDGPLAEVTLRFGAGAALRSTGAGGSAFASPGPTRRFTFSTTTDLLRPWLKLWRTTPCSTPPRLSVSVLVEVTLSFSPLFLFVSVIRVHISGRCYLGAAFPA